VGVEVATSLAYESVFQLLYIYKLLTLDIIEPRSYSLSSFPEHYGLYKISRAKGGTDLYLYGLNPPEFIVFI
jgi:hypothetical protein